MGDWRSKMGRASFRGVEFYVETAELEGGRRTVRHEYPLRDVPFSEDLGRKGRSFSIDGHVVGDSYLEDRDALLSALEERGPGELVHPYYGTRRVVCSGFRVRESTGEGGVAVFSISFDETEEAPTFPAARSSPENVDATGDAVVAALRIRAEIAGAVALPAAYRESVESVVSGVAQALAQALAPVVSTVQELAALEQLTADMEANAASLASSPADALDSILALFDALPSLPERDGVTALLRAAGFVASTERPPASTSTREAEQAVYDVLDAVARVTLLVQAARLASLAAWENYEDAVGVRDQIADALDAAVEFAGDEMFAQVQQLRSDLARSVPGEDSDLPRLAVYTPPVTVPSLVLAQRLYGSIDREADICARNRVKRPGAIPGGAPLEVLSDA